MGIITISRQYGAGAEELAEKLSGRTGYRIVDRIEIQKKLIDIADEGTAKRVIAEKAPNILDRLTGDIKVLKGLLKESILFFSKEGEVILLGRGGFEILKDIRGVLNILVTDRHDARASRISLKEEMRLADAREKIRKVDREKAGFIKYYYGIDWPHPSHFHVSLTPLTMGIEKCTESLVKIAEIMGIAAGFESAGKNVIQERYLIAASTNRIALNVGLDTELFDLTLAEDNTIEIHFFHVPAELRKKAIRVVGDFTKDYNVRQAKSSIA